MDPDYIIVGGGVYGCGLAWELASAGASVLLLERETIAAGSSGGVGARGVRADARELRELSVARRAQELWPYLDDRLGERTGYERVGGLRLIEEPMTRATGGMQSVQAQAWMQNRAGVSTVLLNRDEVLDLEPGVSDLVTHALYCPADAVAPQEQTTGALASAAYRRGAVILEHSAALRLASDGSRVVAVETATDSYRATVAVIVAANAGSAALVGSAAVPSWSVAPQVALIDPVGGHSISHLVSHWSRQLSLKAGPGSTVQVSGGWRGRWNADLLVPEVDDAIVHAAVAQAVAAYPGLADARLVLADASRVESCSPDGIPVVDLVPGYDNLFIASQWTAHGFALFPAVVEALAAWLLDGSRPAALEPFSASRFASAQVVAR